MVYTEGKENDEVEPEILNKWHWREKGEENSEDLIRVNARGRYESDINNAYVIVTMNETNRVPELTPGIQDSL